MGVVRLGLLALLMVMLAPAGARAASPCTLYADAASPTDARPGTEAFPFKTLQKLIDELDPGETGCLLGTTAFASADPATIPAAVFAADDGGTAAAPVTLRSANPAAPPAIDGAIRIDQEADDVVLEGLRIELGDFNTPGIRIEGERVVLRGNDIANDDGVGGVPCVFVGPDNRPAPDVRIEGNRIHDCGSYAINLNDADRAAVVDNYVFSNPDVGILLYPDPDGATIANNVVDANDQGIRIGAESGTVVTGVRVADNVVTNNPTGHVTDGFAVGASGTDNQVTGTCWGGTGPGSPAGTPNLSVSGNVAAGANPYVGAPANYALQSGICTGKGPRPGAVTGSATAGERAATVRGTVEPHFQATTWRIKWGTTPDPQTLTAVQSAGSGPVAVDVSAGLTDLAPGTTYYYRVVAANNSGSREGAVHSFTTAALSDGDGDGVPDERDLCASTPRGPVDFNLDGCPDDSDRDGVIDERDGCDLVPRGTFDADVDGCPDDSDGDGVVDERDSCRSAHRGRFGGEDGCPGVAPALRATVTETHAFFKRGRRLTAIFYLSVTVRAEVGSRVRVRCLKGCKLTERRTVGRSGKLSLKSLRKRRLPLTAIVEIMVTRVDRTGTAVRLSADRRRGRIVRRTLCVPAGTTRPKTC